MKHYLPLVLLICLFLKLQGQVVPTFEQVISIRGAGSPSLSPDGKSLAFTISSTDWTENKVDNEIWLSKDGKRSFQLTNTPKEVVRGLPGLPMENGLRF